MTVIQVSFKGGDAVEHIHNVIKKAREKTGKTQQQIADEVEVSRAYYADVERGRYTPSLKVLAKLAVILNIDLNFLRK